MERRLLLSIASWTPSPFTVLATRMLDDTLMLEPHDDRSALSPAVRTCIQTDMAQASTKCLAVRGILRPLV